jgi:hypothetical protein
MRIGESNQKSGRQGKMNANLSIIGNHEDEMNILESKDRQQFHFKKRQQHLMLNQKISTVLDASPLKNSYIGKIFHDRY